METLSELDHLAQNFLFPTATPTLLLKKTNKLNKTQHLGDLFRSGFHLPSIEQGHQGSKYDIRQLLDIIPLACLRKRNLTSTLHLCVE